MSLLLSPGAQFLDENGTPLASGKVHFYVPGTVTDKTIYSDYALTSESANPVVLDSEGRLGDKAIYGLDEAYKIKLATSADVAIETVDNFYPPPTVSAGLSDAIRKICGNTQTLVESSDQSAALQALIDNAAFGEVLDLLGKTVRCDSAITLSSNITIQNGDLDFALCADASDIIAEGTVGTPQLLSANCTETTFTTSASIGATAGSLVMLYAQGTAYWSGGVKTVGELVRIKSVSGNVHTFESIPHEYPTFTTANSAAAALVTPIDGLTLRNVRIIGKKADGSNTKVMSVRRATNLRVENCEFDSWTTSGLSISDSVDCVVRDSRFLNGDNASTGGVKICDLSRNVTIDHCHFRPPQSSTATDSYTAIEVGAAASGTVYGPVRDVLIFDCEFDSYGYGVYFPQDADWQDVDIVDCRFGKTYANEAIRSYDSGGRLSIRENRFRQGNDGVINLPLNPIRQANGLQGLVEISRNKFYWGQDVGATTAILVSMTDSTLYSGNGYRLSICDNELHGVSDAIGVTVETGALGECRIDGNIIYLSDAASADRAISVTASAAVDIDMLSINRNKIRSGSVASVLIEVGCTAQNLSVSDNDIDGDPQTAAIYVHDGGDSSGADLLTLVEICHNRINIGDLVAILIEDASLLNVSDNIIDTTGVGIKFTLDYRSASGYVFCRNIINAPSVGLDINTTSGWVMTGCTIQGNQVLASSSFAVDLDADITGCVVSGNTFIRANNTADCVTLDGATASNLIGLSVTGNVFYNGIYGVSTTNDSDSVQDGNSFVGQATGTATGFATAGDSA
jgi:hypothetical protein